MNLKVYALKKINDDYFITTVNSANVIAQALGSFAWGYLAENFNYKWLHMAQNGAFFVLGVTLPPVMGYKSLFMIWYILIGIATSGFYSCAGPGLLQIFGNKIGAKLFPIRMAMSALAYVSYPMMNWLAMSALGLDNIVYVLGSMCAVAFLLSFKLKLQYSW